MVHKGFIYTVAADIYAFRPAFSSILHCVLHHFTLRLAQNTLHFAPKHTAFSGILHRVLH